MATVTSNNSENQRLIIYTGGVFSRVGGMPVTIPTGLFGEFFVDLLGSPDGMIDNRNNGSSITFGFGGDPGDPVTVWANATGDPAVDGSLAYAPGAGPLSFFVGVPEPTSILLLACGLCFVMRSINKRNSFE